ncbi:MAG: DUF2905 domain-containing protein [Alphaproteobacteria bacterium]|nr:DUF2905 domain-containing protein [Alphaproteobacteria bacterium]
MQKFLIVAGIVFVALGLLWPLLAQLGLGHLPGDFSYRGAHVSFYFPLGTSVVVSLVLTLILWLLNR